MPPRSAPPPLPDQPPLDSLAEPLVAWFREHARALPWRSEVRDPYRVWVSEIMLQQTQVETVKGYYAPFLARFPSVVALAQASEDEVLTAWQGLGFYRRARNLHRAARQVVAEHGGQVPREAAALLKLPGLGRYTVGAILSLVDDARLPILDGNVARVLSRIYQISGGPQQGATQRQLWALAEATLPPVGAGAYNEALMELGALVCRPTSPACPRCPLREQCGARAAGCPEAYPEPKPRTEVPLIERSALCLTRETSLLLQQRPDEGLLARLWELPSRELGASDDPHAAARAQLLALGLQGELSYLGASEHRFSHRHWTTHVFSATNPVGADQVRGERLEWVELEELERYALPTASKKTLRLAGV